jgi:hypothetical protein
MQQDYICKILIEISWKVWTHYGCDCQVANKIFSSSDLVRGVGMIERQEIKAFWQLSNALGATK